MNITNGEARAWLKELVRWYPYYIDTEKVNNDKKAKELADQIESLQVKVDRVEEFRRLVAELEKETVDEVHKMLYKSICVSLDILLKYNV